MAALETAVEVETSTSVREGLPVAEASLLDAVCFVLSAMGENMEGGPSTWYPPSEDFKARLGLAAAAAEAAEAILRLLGFLIQNHMRLADLPGHGVGRALAGAAFAAFKLLRCASDLAFLQPLAGRAASQAPSAALLAASYNATASAAKVGLSWSSLSERHRGELSSGEADVGRGDVLRLLSRAATLWAYSFYFYVEPSMRGQSRLLTNPAERHRRRDGRS